MKLVDRLNALIGGEPSKPKRSLDSIVQEATKGKNGGQSMVPEGDIIKKKPVMIEVRKAPVKMPPKGFQEKGYKPSSGVGVGQ